MPCRVDYTDDHRAQIIYRDAPEELKVEIANLKRYLDLTTRLLCASMKKFEQARMGHLIDEIEDGEARTWWTEHQRVDQIREEREVKQLRESALAKLTVEEQKILGLLQDVPMT